MKLAVLEIAYIFFFHKILQDFFDKTVKNHSSMLILSIFDNFWKIRIFSQTLSPLCVPGLRCSILGSTYMINFLNFFYAEPFVAVVPKCPKLPSYGLHIWFSLLKWVMKTCSFMSILKMKIHFGGKCSKTRKIRKK